MEKIFLPKFEEKKKRVLAKKTQFFLLNLGSVCLRGCGCVLIKTQLAAVW
jgi:hypothetical protein